MVLTNAFWIFQEFFRTYSHSATLNCLPWMCTTWYGDCTKLSCVVSIPIDGIPLETVLPRVLPIVRASLPRLRGMTCLSLLLSANWVWCIPLAWLLPCHRLTWKVSDLSISCMWFYMPLIWQVCASPSHFIARYILWSAKSPKSCWMLQLSH